MRVVYFMCVPIIFGSHSASLNPDVIVECDRRSRDSPSPAWSEEITGFRVFIKDPIGVDSNDFTELLCKFENLKDSILFHRRHFSRNHNTVEQRGGPVRSASAGVRRVSFKESSLKRRIPSVDAIHETAKASAGAIIRGPKRQQLIEPPPAKWCGKLMGASDSDENYTRVENLKNERVVGFDSSADRPILIELKICNLPLDTTPKITHRERTYWMELPPPGMSSVARQRQPQLVYSIQPKQREVSLAIRVGDSEDPTPRISRVQSKRSAGSSMSVGRLRDTLRYDSAISLFCSDQLEPVETDIID
jgi:hypothetical protein